MTLIIYEFAIQKINHQTLDNDKISFLGNYIQQYQVITPLCQSCYLCTVCMYTYICILYTLLPIPQVLPIFPPEDERWFPYYHLSAGTKLQIQSNNVWVIASKDFDNLTAGFNTPFTLTVVKNGVIHVEYRIALHYNNKEHFTQDSHLSQEKEQYYYQIFGFQKKQYLKKAVNFSIKNPIKYTTSKGTQIILKTNWTREIRRQLALICG